MGSEVTVLLSLRMVQRATRSVDTSDVWTRTRRALALEHDVTCGRGLEHGALSVARRHED